MLPIAGESRAVQPRLRNELGKTVANAGPAREVHELPGEYIQHNSAGEMRPAANIGHFVKPTDAEVAVAYRKFSQQQKTEALQSLQTLSTLGNNQRDRAVKQLKLTNAAHLASRTPELLPAIEAAITRADFLKLAATISRTINTRS